MVWCVCVCVCVLLLHPIFPLRPALQADFELRWLGEYARGVAVDLESPGYKALCGAIQKEAPDKFKPFSLTGLFPTRFSFYSCVFFVYQLL